MIGMLKSNFGYIYRTTNTITKQVYIGKKEGRFTQKYLGSGIHLKRAVKKFGPYVFKVEMIAQVESREELNRLERCLIAWYRKELGRREVYNIADGGDGGNVWKNGSPTLEQRIAIGKSSVGNKNHKEGCICCICKSHRFGRKGILNPMFGKHFKQTQETIEKIKRTKAEHPYKHSKERRDKISKVMTGIKRGNYKRIKDINIVSNNISIKTKEAMWRPEVREKYLAGIQKRGESKKLVGKRLKDYV